MPNLAQLSDLSKVRIAYQTLTFKLHPAANQIATNDKLWSFVALPVGWHYGQGAAPSIELISLLVEINNQVYRLGFPKTDAFPGINGNLMLTIYYGEHLIDLTVEPNGRTCTYSYEKNGEEVAYEEDISLSTAMEMIKQVGELCRLSEPYTNYTMTTRNVGSQVSLSKPQTMEVFLFSQQNAPWSTLEVSVNTSANIMYRAA